MKEQVTEWPVNISSSGSAAYLSYFLDFLAPKGPSSTTQAGSIAAPPAPAGAPYLVKEAYTYFKDDQEKRSIVSICDDAYEDMKRLVADAEKGSWKAASI